MALTKLMGQNFRVFVGTTPVLEATSCQCTIQGNLEDATTKDSPSGYNMDQMTSKQWSVQVDGVDATLANLRTLITRFNSDAKTTVGWDKTSGENNTVSDNADFSRTGSAILNDLSIQANNRQTIQVSCQYQGSGILA
jgi:hypothetical protein